MVRRGRTEFRAPRVAGAGPPPAADALPPGGSAGGCTLPRSRPGTLSRARCRCSRPHLGWEVEPGRQHCPESEPQPVASRTIAVDATIMLTRTVTGIPGSRARFPGSIQAMIAGQRSWRTAWSSLTIAFRTQGLLTGRYEMTALRFRLRDRYGLVPFRGNAASLRGGARRPRHTTFDTDGMVTTAISSGKAVDLARAVAIQADGKISLRLRLLPENGIGLRLLPGPLQRTAASTPPSTPTASWHHRLRHRRNVDLRRGHPRLRQDRRRRYCRDGVLRQLRLALARYNTDGSLDTTFDTDGKVTTAFFAVYEDSLRRWRSRPTARSSPPRDATAASPTADFALPVHPNGSLDTTFDPDGKLTTGLSPADLTRLTGVVIQADGEDRRRRTGYCPSYNRRASPNSAQPTTATGSLDGSFGTRARSPPTIGGTERTSGGDAGRTARSSPPAAAYGSTD